MRHSLHDPKNTLKILRHGEFNKTYTIRVTCPGHGDEDTVFEITVSEEEFFLTQKLRDMPKVQRESLAILIENYDNRK